MKKIAILIACISLTGCAAHAHVHGGAVPGWYDADCCHERDCRPVDNDAIETRLMPGGDVAFRYIPLNKWFVKSVSHFKRSQDERYHVCIGREGTPYCIYIPTQA